MLEGLPGGGGRVTRAGHKAELSADASLFCPLQALSRRRHPKALAEYVALSTVLSPSVWNAMCLLAKII